MSAGAEIAQRRHELEVRLGESRRDLERAVGELRLAARQRLDPRRVLRRHPLAVLGAAIVIGLWLGVRGDGPAARTRTGRIRT